MTASERKDSDSSDSRKTFIFLMFDLFYRVFLIFFLFFAPPPPTPVVIVYFTDIMKSN